jgi:hypothetical protein
MAARRLAFTSGNSTLDARNPRTFFPAACLAACCMLSISPLPNFPHVFVPCFCPTCETLRLSTELWVKKKAVSGDKVAAIVGHTAN